jgi:superfamily II DNA or RNA helicase
LKPVFAGSPRSTPTSGRDSAFGESLCNQIGRWSEKQTQIAHKMCLTYRNTQLADLDLPDITVMSEEVLKHEASSARAAAHVEAVYTCTVENGFGLKWGAAKEVSTARGWKQVKSAPIPDSSPFWEVYRASKPALNAAGYALSKFGGVWQLAHWSDSTSRVVVPVAAYALREIDPVGLLPYQVASVQHLVASLEAFNAALDASDVGTGKTYAALKAASLTGKKKILTVSPKAVIPSWKKAAKHFGIEISSINYEMVRRGTTQWGKWSDDDKKFIWDASLIDCLIFDEVHRAKSMTSQNMHLVVACRDAGITTLLLSATAATNPTEMRAVGYCLGLFPKPSLHWKWCLNHGCVAGAYGGIFFDGGGEYLTEIHREIFPRKGSRVRVADLGDAFPETQISTQLLELNGATAKINAAYAAANAAAAAVRRKEVTDPFHHLTAMLRARQLSEISKIPSIVEQVEDAVEQGMSVAVFLNFTDSLKAVIEGLSPDITVVQIHGQQTAEERQSAIEQFQADTARVIVAITQAGGVGVSLHDLHGNHPRLSIISPTWSAIDMRQVLGRVWRAGGLTKSLQHLVFAAGTIEEKVAATVEAKLENLDLLNDGEL